MKLYEVVVYRDDADGTRGYDYYLVKCKKGEDPVKKLEKLLEKTGDLPYVNLERPRITEIKGDVSLSHHHPF